MLRSEFEAQEAVNNLGITDPSIRLELYKNLLHSLKLQYNEYPRLPRKLKKRMQIAKKAAITPTNN